MKEANLSEQVAKHFREVHTGGNWTWSNLKDVLDGVTWQQATTKVHDLNTIAVLTYHVNFYVVAINNVLKGNPIAAHDKDAFNCPAIDNEQDWQDMIKKTLDDAAECATLIEKLPEEKLWETFAAEKYGIYYRNLHGCIEHTHYHLGQIAVIKKILQKK